ncbi:uncharacterized protein LOC121789335 [Salvia splendens]|uniref:uncharacterized protein LOC121789335 n=1 Tax=Salvia splendens TaxID=180675 RepID=UPI001C274CCF|nr:uncharacterized protein LOC121789335 [Salvia splendens]
MNNHRMTPEVAAQFGDGIQMVFSRWAALRMAIENGWGGRDSLQKLQQLGHNLLNFLTQSKDQVYIGDVEDILYEFMDSLNIEIQDGSPNSDDEEDSDEDDAIIENNSQQWKLMLHNTAPIGSQSD